MQARVSDSVHFLDFVNFFAKLQKDPQYSPALKSLVVIDGDAHMENVLPQSLASFLGKVEQSDGSNTWAIVLSNGTHKSVFSAALRTLAPRRVKFQVFDEELSALHWLKSF